MTEKALMAEMAREQIKTRLEELRAQTGNTAEFMNKTIETTNMPQFSEQINLVKDLQQKIIDLQTEQSKREKAIVDYELSRHSVANNSGHLEQPETTGTESPIKGNFGAAFTLRQAKLNEELQDLNRALALKEELMTKMTANDSRFVVMKTSYERNLKDYEDQVNNLMKEKDELMQKLRNAANHSASNKIAEQRRKRLQELEGLITELKRKIGEQGKLLKIKEQSEQKVTKLSSEIQNMKSARVKLIRQMKEDGEKFRKWKAQKDREVAKLKEEDRRKQFQIVKMERLHSKQQNVLKRKMEEAVAINKRLKDAMALQKDCQDRRNASKDIGSVSNRIRNWLEGELEVVIVRKQAKKSLQALIEDRKTISEELSVVKGQLENGKLSPAQQQELETKKESLEQELQMRTAQISDMQVKVVEEDGETNKKKWWDSIQTMIEAKCALQFLFEEACGSKALATSYESDLKELNTQYEEIYQNLQEAEIEAKSSLKEMTDKHQQETDKLLRENEDKILFLLRQMPRTQEGELPDKNEEVNTDLEARLKFQEEELSRLSHLHDLLQQKTAECEELKQRFQELQSTSAKFQEKERSQVTIDEITPARKVKKVSAARLPPPKPPRVSPPYLDLDSSSDEEEEAEEDKERIVDPDWRKTPLFKKIQQLTDRGRMWARNETYGGDETRGLKRNSSGELRCGCSKDCSSRLCRCRKGGNACSTYCKCNAIRCINRSSLSSQSSDGNKEETFLNSTFDVSIKNENPLSENVAVPKKRLRSSEMNEQSKSGTENEDPAHMKIPTLNFTMPPL